MKSKRQEIVKSSYPCLKSFHSRTTPQYDIVVLFSEQRCGVIVWSTADPITSFTVGYSSNSWLENDFEPFNDEITLSN